MAYDDWKTTDITDYGPRVDRDDACDAEELTACEQCGYFLYPDEVHGGNCHPADLVPPAPVLTLVTCYACGGKGTFPNGIDMCPVCPGTGTRWCMV